MIVWGFVPARGGSKSIPLKNLANLGGRPLLDYGVRAAQRSGRLTRLICSTDHEAIAAHARELGLEVHGRPSCLAGDDAKVDAVAQQFLENVPLASRPDAIVLIQPTSPFLLPAHIGQLIDALVENPAIASVHNVIPVPHNLHAWNQRALDGEKRVSFLFAAERARARNKQEKPALFAFGNLIAARSSVLLRGDGFYAGQAKGIVIPGLYGFDVDTAEDLAVADALILAGVMRLDHMSEP